MARYIIIDNYSGHIVGDTATQPLYQMDVRTACHWLAQRDGERVAWLGPHDRGYRVYAADHQPVVHDPRNAHLIETIELECPLVVMVRM